MTQSQSPRQASPLKSSVQKSYAKLPPYLHKRGSYYYFKRKVPADASVALPSCGEQVSLGRQSGMRTLSVACHEIGDGIGTPQ